MQYTFNTIAFIATLYASATNNQNLMTFLIVYWTWALIAQAVEIYQMHKAKKTLKEMENEIEDALMNAVRRHEKYVFNKDKGLIEKKAQDLIKEIDEFKSKKKRVVKVKSIK